MTRTQFKSMLIRAVQDELLTEDEARTLLRRFDAGEISDADLPLPLSEAIIGANDSDVEKAVTALGLALVFASLLPRERAREALQDKFMAKARGLSENVSAVSDWQQTFSVEIGQYILKQSILGRGRLLEPSEIVRADGIIKAEQAFLSRFAEEVAFSRINGNPMSADAIGSRSELYAGRGRAEWFTGHEEVQGDGTVIDYVSVDDNGTCEPCLSAESQGPYLPNDGPLPGQVCDGFGRCRCERVPRYAPDEARALA